MVICEFCIHDFYQLHDRCRVKEMHADDPFKLMDLIGNDINYAVSCSVYEQLGQPERLRPSDIQKQKVESGRLGKKSGEGYYSY